MTRVGFGSTMKLSCFAIFVFAFAYQSLSSCWCLNSQGLVLFRVKEGLLSGPFAALSSRKSGKVVASLSFTEAEDVVNRRLLQAAESAPSGVQNEETKPSIDSRLPFFDPFAPLLPPPGSHTSPPLTKAVSASPQASQTPSPYLRGKRTSPRIVPSPPPNLSTPESSLSEGPTTVSVKRSSSKTNLVAILAGTIGGVVFLAIVIVGIYLWRGGKVATVKPWATGLSGQLQKAFVTGVPKLKRSELQIACEDFSNVIGSSPIGTMYKGTLSNGVEIAVTSVSAKSSNQWSKNLELQFRKKVETLSKVSHKNFVNLIGYCVEEDRFTRLMVFEYAPNGTLFEHIHFKEAEHLDWGMRLRIAMGMAYSLDHMHQLDPPVAHANLNSSAVYLTEDYAAKISEFTFWNELSAAGTKTTNITNGTRESNVYSFGVILVEMVTGKLPYSVNDYSLEDWASDYLRGEEALAEIVDPTLDSCDKEQVKKIGEVVKRCVHPDPCKRPNMKEVAKRLREITSITPEIATPKLSPLWWAEIEVATTDAD